MAVTIESVQQQIIRELDGLGDGFEKYEHLISLGKQSAPEDESLRTEEHALPGCQSRVWIRTSLDGGLLHFEADSDSHLIRGVLALLLRTLNDRPPAEIATAKLDFLERAGLTTSLSPSRANGVATIVRELRRRAEKAQGGPTTG